MKRGNTIKYAVYTAVASKATSSLVQLIALPLAARVLGREEFGIYSTITIALFTITLLQFGVGPSLTRLIASASAKKRRSAERHIYQHGAILVISLAVVFGGVLALLFNSMPIGVLFGANFAGWESTMRQALWVGLALLTVEIMMWHTDAVRHGYLESYLVNGFSSIGNLLGALIIIFGLQAVPTIPFLLIATFAPNILVRLISTYFLWKKRSYLIAKTTYFRKKTFKRLATDGFSFSATTDLVFLLEVTACGILIARILGPGEVAIYQIFVSITAIFRRILETVGAPFWTASINAKENSDRDWMRKSTLRLYLFYGTMAVSAFAFLVGLGPWLVVLLYGSEFQLDRSLFATQACFLTMLGWRDVNRYVLIGNGKLYATVPPVLQGLLLSLTLGVAGLLYAGMEWMFIGLALGILLIPGWRLAREVFLEFRRDPSPSSQLMATTTR
ncbi:MAG: oligosaccharide flippase family protein [Verrucomicrobiota bacterium]